MLTVKDNGRRQAPLFPSALLQFRNSVVDLRIAQTKIADEFPVGRNIECARSRLRVEDRYPAHADTLRTRREPNRVHRSYRGIFGHLRHGTAAEPVSLFGGAISKNRKMS